MAWADEHGIAARLSRIHNEEDRLPLILCGPILRRTEENSVTVWVALKEARTVTLRVYSHAPPPALESLREELQGTRRTVRLGTNLHVVAVTARPLAADRPLAAGTVYFYNLFFSQASVSVVPETADHLNTSDVVDLVGDPSFDDPEPTSLSYSFEHRLPSFSLPPIDLNKLRLVHGSCRKVNADGSDAMSVLDQMISLDFSIGDARPHLLLLAGDQIYADDMAHILLFLVMDAEKSLLNWNGSEPVPDVTSPKSMQPGLRIRIVKQVAKLTTEDTKNHLIRFGEFAAKYLFAWSPVLWPKSFPTFEDVVPEPFPITIKRDGYDGQRANLLAFHGTLRKVRRAMANLPVYMIFDDHEITDDWNMLRDFCERVYGTRLGRRIVQNGLLAYAIFQAWGNTPERFDTGQLGDDLLFTAAGWSASNGTNTILEEEIARLVGIPGVMSSSGQLTGLFTPDGPVEQLSRPTGALQWHYTIKGPKFEILVLDSRTRRGFPSEKLAAPDQIAPTALGEQVPLDDADPDKLFLIVASTNVVSIPFFYGRKVFGEKFIFDWWYIVFFIVRHILVPLFSDFQPYEPDLRDSWEPQTRGFESLLSRLARRVKAVNGKRTVRTLVLSGDVHFSWAARMQYWADRPFEADANASEPVEAIFAYLTSSSLKKQTTGLFSGTLKLHNWGYIPMTDSMPGPVRWFGWRQPAAVGISAQDMVRLADWAHFEPFMNRRVPPMLAIKEAEELDAFIPRPDWRYRIDFILGEKSGINLTLNLLEKPDPSDHEKWFKVIGEAHRRYRDYALKYGDGMELVGKNNIAELNIKWEGTTTLVGDIGTTDNSFQVANVDLLPAPPLFVTIDDEVVQIGAVDRGTNTCSAVVRKQHGTTAASHNAGATVEVFKTVLQTHWWRLTDEAKLVPLTRFIVSLSYLDQLYPKPKLPGETIP